jgi:putative oxidoreductase
MAEVNSFFSSATPRLQSVLRIVAAFLFMLHGAQKLFGFLAPAGAQGPPMWGQLWIGGVLEFFGGLLLLLGLFTRPVAFILSGMMAVAYFQMHVATAISKSNPNWFWPLQGGNGGELAALYCFVFLFFAVAGGGELSLDRLLRRR